jgi:DNA ligase-associated metallophosphoesterase
MPFTAQPESSTSAAGSVPPFRTRLAGESVELHAERALHWLRQRTLFVADVHLGKAASFRAGGVALPRGTTAADLDRLSRVLSCTGAERLIVLGDFIHAFDGRVEALDAAFRRWRDRHRALTIVVVRGNHDAQAGDAPEDWHVKSVNAPHAFAPFLACHEPWNPPSGYALCGHVHPGARLSGPGFDRARVPCFVLGPRRALLPAYGGFTGLATLSPAPGDRVVAIAGRRLFQLPP